MKLIVDGETTVADGAGQSITVIRAASSYFPLFGTITFSTEDCGVGGPAGQQGAGEA